MLRKCKWFVTTIEMSHERIKSTTEKCASMCTCLSAVLYFDYFLLITLQVVCFCPEWQEETSPKTPLTPQGVSPTIVNEGNVGNEAGRKMWGQGEISRTKVVQSVSC